MDKINTKPNLFIVGAAKSGTTSLHNYLKQHPQIYMSAHKEPHFLINSDIGKDRIHKAILKLEDYKEAEYLARKLVKRYPKDLQYQLGVIIAQHKSGKTKKADIAYKRLLKDFDGGR